jgi:hypothetical protein
MYSYIFMAMVLIEEQDNHNLYTSNNLFRGETTINEILSPLSWACAGSSKIH